MASTAALRPFAGARRPSRRLCSSLYSAVRGYSQRLLRSDFSALQCCASSVLSTRVLRRLQGVARPTPAAVAHRTSPSTLRSAASPLSRSATPKYPAGVHSVGRALRHSRTFIGSSFIVSIRLHQHQLLHSVDSVERSCASVCVNCADRYSLG